MTSNFVADSRFLMCTVTTHHTQSPQWPKTIYICARIETRMTCFNFRIYMQKYVWNVWCVADAKSLHRFEYLYLNLVSSHRSLTSWYFLFFFLIYFRSLRAHLQLHRIGSGVRFLDMVICAIETTGTRRYHFHCAAQATAHLFALVPSHHRADLLMVLVHWIHIVGQMVHCNELLRAFGHVLVLCVTRNGLQTTSFHCHGHHIDAINANDCRLRHQYLGKWLPENDKSFGMPHIRDQYQTIDCHVLQLFRTFR